MCFDFSRDVTTCHEGVPRNPGWNGAVRKKKKKKRKKKEEEEEKEGGLESWVTTRRENFLRGNLFRITTHG